MQFSRPCLVNPRLLDRLAGSARAGSPSILRPTGPPPSSPSSFLPPKPAFSYPFVARSLPNPPSKKETPGEGTHTSPRWSKALQNDRRPPAAPPLNLQPSDFPPYLPPPTSVRIEDHDVESVFAPIVKAGWQLERGLGGGDGMQEVVYLSKTVKGGGWAEQLDLLATFNAIFQLHNHHAHVVETKLGETLVKLITHQTIDPLASADSDQPQRWGLTEKDLALATSLQAAEERKRSDSSLPKSLSTIQPSSPPSSPSVKNEIDATSSSRFQPPTYVSPLTTFSSS